jgi:hypothetical protein
MTALKLCEASLLSLEQELEAAEVELVAAKGKVNSIRIELESVRNEHIAIVEKATRRSKPEPASNAQKAECQLLRCKAIEFGISVVGMSTPKLALDAQDMIHMLTRLVRDEKDARLKAYKKSA